MKTILTRLTNEQANKELIYLPVIAIVLTIIPLFIFGFLVIANVAASGRGLALTFHKSLVNNPKINLYRIIFIVCGVISLLEAIFYFSSL
ncbi:MAG: hypothetical protein PVI21_02405 [Candidatus Woesebacteria bacterium]|jgi:hypothetical protein